MASVYLKLYEGFVIDMKSKLDKMVEEALKEHIEPCIQTLIDDFDFKFHSYDMNDDDNEPCIKYVALNERGTMTGSNIELFRKDLEISDRKLDKLFGSQILVNFSSDAGFFIVLDDVESAIARRKNGELIGRIEIKIVER